jgi:DNA-binding IclR family transcriptional regulator
MLLLLLLRWGELPSAHQISRLLGLDRRTVVRYLRELVRLGFIERHPKKNSYRLAQQLNEEQRLLLAFLDPTQPRGA